MSYVQNHTDVVCLLIGFDIYCLDRGDFPIKKIHLKEEDPGIYSKILREANTLVLVIGDGTSPEYFRKLVQFFQKNFFLAECFSILSDQNHFELDNLLKFSAVLKMKKNEMEQLLRSSALDQFLSFVNCDNGRVRLDKADIRSVINNGHLGRFTFVSANGRNKFAKLSKKIKPRFPHPETRALILYLVSDIESDLMEIEQAFFEVSDCFSPETWTMFGVGMEVSPELADNAVCFLLY